MAGHSKKRASQTSSELSKGSSSSSRSKSLEKGSRAPSSYKLSDSIKTQEPLPVSWKKLKRRWPWLKQLHQTQRKGVKAANSVSGFAALFEQRTGKTWVTCALLCVERKVNHEVLLVGPLTNLESTWKKNLQERCDWFTIHRDLESYDKDKKANPTGHRILLLNPEQVTPIRDKLKRRKWDRFIWDEAQRLKNRSSQSSRDASIIGPSAKRRLALTGTPIDENPKDLWALMRFVEPRCLGTGWGDFEDYFIEKPDIDLSKPMRAMQRQRMMLRAQIAKRKAPMRKDRLQEFSDRVSLNVKRITKEQMGIVRANTHSCLFDLDPPELVKYRQLEKTMVVKVKKQTIVTPLKITQIGKLQQMTGGHIKNEDGETIKIGTSKKKELKRLIEKHAPDDRLVIFCKFVWEVHMIEKMIRKMGYHHIAKLWGKIKDLKRDKRRTNMLLAFQRGEFDVMICQQRTGGVGVDLYMARKFFVYSMGHSYIDYDQMLSRGDFIHQAEPADFFFVTARGTIDSDILSSVARKKSITQLFYDRLQRQP